jgi:hypothetical protein
LGVCSSRPGRDLRDHGQIHPCLRRLRRSSSPPVMRLSEPRHRLSSQVMPGCRRRHADKESARSKGGPTVVRGRRATSPLYHFSRGPERCPLYLDEQVSRSESVGSAKCQMPVRRNSAHILGYRLRGNHAVATLMFRAIEPLIGDTQCVDFLSDGSSEGRDLGLRSYGAARNILAQLLPRSAALGVANRAAIVREFLRSLEAIDTEYGRSFAPTGKNGVAENPNIGVPRESLPLWRRFPISLGLSDAYHGRWCLRAVYAATTPCVAGSPPRTSSPMG